MSQQNIIYYREAEYRSYASFLQCWDWEWMATLTFPQPDKEYFGRDRVKDRLLFWTRRLCVTERIQVGYFYVLSSICKHPHLHVLMIGLGNVNGEKKTLLDVSRSRWEHEWPFFAKIEQPDSIADVARYVAVHKLWFKSDWATIDFYNTDLLNKLRKVWF